MSNSFLRDFARGPSAPGRGTTLYLHPRNKHAVLSGIDRIKNTQRLRDLSIVLADDGNSPSVIGAPIYSALTEMMLTAQGHLPNLQCLSVVAEHSRRKDFCPSIPMAVAGGLERPLEVLTVERVNMSFCALFALTQRGRAKHVRLCDVTSRCDKIHRFATNHLQTLEFNGMADLELVRRLIQSLHVDAQVRLIYSPSDTKPEGEMTEGDWDAISAGNWAGVHSLCLRNAVILAAPSVWDDLAESHVREILLENTSFGGNVAFEHFARCIARNPTIFCVRIRNSFEDWDTARFETLFDAVARSESVRWLELARCPPSAVEQLSEALPSMSVEVLHLDLLPTLDSAERLNMRARLMSAFRQNTTLGAFSVEKALASELGLMGIAIKTTVDCRLDLSSTPAPIVDHTDLLEICEICLRNYSRVNRLETPQGGSPASDHFRLPSNVGHDSSVETIASQQQVARDPLLDMMYSVARTGSGKRSRSPNGASIQKSVKRLQG